MAEVRLEAIGPERRETVANLFQLYVHDFTDFWTERRVELQEDGRFPPYPWLDSFWSEAGREAFLIRADGQIAGFMLINRHSHAGLVTDYAVAEFFVARHYRLEGVGRVAALSAIRARPGQWEIAVSRRNLAAQALWRGVAAAVAGPAVEERNNTGWDGPILRFRAG